MAKRKVDYSVLRSGGAIGDTSMQEQADWNDNGAGVVENIQTVPSDSKDPNQSSARLPQKDGAED